MNSISRKLEKANKINEEIKELDDFISYSEMTWTGKFLYQKHKYVLFSMPYGYIGEKTIYLDTETKNKVLDILRDRLKSLDNELSQLFKED